MSICEMPAVMRWRTLNPFRLPTDGPSWRHSHCQLPTALPLDTHRVRVFFASRNAEQRSHIGYVDLRFDANDPDRYTVEQLSPEPVMQPGPIGCFDEHGVFPSCIVQHDGVYYLYYIGWNQGAEAPMFYAAIGLARSTDGVHFARMFSAPIMSRSEHDPCLVTSPHVYRHGEQWRMTYVSGTAWTRDAHGSLHSQYHIKHAESADGIAWVREGHVAIDLAPGESNIARSAVYQSADGAFHMWFGYVHRDIGRYRMGYARSPDGITWTRDDDAAGIDLDHDLAMDMISYPSVFSLGNETYMLYNGDGFGRAGFGVARLVAADGNTSAAASP